MLSKKTKSRLLLTSPDCSDSALSRKLDAQMVGRWDCLHSFEPRCSHDDILGGCMIDNREVDDFRIIFCHDWEFDRSEGHRRYA